MKRKLLSIIVLVSILMGLVSSASAVSVSASPAVQQTSQIPPQSVIVRLYFTSQDDLNQLAARYDILQVDHTQGYALLILTPDEVALLQQAGYRTEVDQGKTKLLNQPRQALTGQGTDSIPGFPCYRTVEETQISLQNIALNHSDMAQLIDIGDSWDKVMPGGLPGYDILALRLTNENFGVIDEKPTFFLMAEIHAREYATAELATRYAEYLINNYGTDPDVTWLLDYFRVYIVSMTNPDGRKLAEQGQYWRKNVDNDDGCINQYSWGTDLNRNSSFKWNHGGSSPYACDETYMGPSAGSEAEVQAIETFVQTLFTDQRGPGDTDPAPLDSTGVFVTLHSAAALVLWPWGWSSSPAPNGAQLQTLGRHLAYFNGYTPQQSYQLYQTSGTTDEFIYGTLGIPAFTFEMTGEFFQNCSSFENTDYPDNRDALLYAFKTARRPYMTPAGPDSLNVSTSPAAVTPGEPVQLAATANDGHYAGGEPHQNIADARYTIDSPSWITGTLTYPMTASDGNFNNYIEAIQGTIDTTGLASGRHTIFVESKDANNNWGVTSSTFLYIVDPGVSPVIEGYVLQASNNQPVAASVTAGLFNTTTDPATGYYTMTVISGTYDMVVDANNFAPAFANGVVAQNYQTVQKDFQLYPICDAFRDDVEGGNLGWTADNPWAITTEASHSPSHSWTDSPGGNYHNYRNVSLTSPTFDLSDATGVTLNFWHEYQTEAGWDYGTVEYSTGGNIWTAVQAYDGSQTWTQEQLAIPGLDGQANARIRFHFTSDSNTNYDGWHIDDISLTAGGPGCMAPTTPQAEFTSNSPVLDGDPMQFTNQTTGLEPMTYAWDFGDGSGTSTNINPSYTYPHAGIFTVNLDATNNLGTSSISHTVTVEPSAITSVDLTQVTTGVIHPRDSVDFSADLLPNDAAMPYDYIINFGDGTIVTGTYEFEPILFFNQYHAGGVYTVQISVWNDVMTEPVVGSLIVNINFEIFLPLTRK